MNNHIFKLLILLLSASLLSGCAGDCKEIEVEVVEWLTNYDTCVVKRKVNYSIQTQDVHSTHYSTVTKQITITNNDSLKASTFRVINYEYYRWSSSYQNRYRYSDSYTIEPLQSHTFVFSNQGKYNYNFNGELQVEQTPILDTLIYRVDTLVRTKQIFNTCQYNIEALEEKYATIEKLYNEKAVKAKEMQKRQEVTKR